MKASTATYALIAAAALASLWAPCFRAYAGGEPSREYMVKAAMVYNFAKFVEWPHDGSGKRPQALRICILGEDPFGEAMEAIEGKTVRGRPVEIRRIQRSEDMDGCSILFVSTSEEGHIREILTETSGMAVLTISEIDGFAAAGGVINFKTVDNKVRFKINPKAAENAHLKISSRLLNLAETVNGY